MTTTERTFLAMLLKDIADLIDNQQYDEAKHKLDRCIKALFVDQQ